MTSQMAGRKPAHARKVTLETSTTGLGSQYSALPEAVEKKERPEQAGFRKGRSCTDHIFVLRQILEQSHEWNNSIYAVFVDFEKAFDSIYRESL